jgi:Secretion system C-terminal sorting domain
MNTTLKLKKVALALACIVLISSKVFAQSVPMLEFDVNALFPPFGPNTNPITVPFSLDLDNDNNNFTLPTTPITVTYSFENEVFTNLGYTNINDGLVFGGGATLSTTTNPFYDPSVQRSASNSTFDFFGSYNGDGGPRDTNFTSYPYATGSQLKTGIVPIQANTNFVNGGVQLFTAAQVLFDKEIKIDTSVYFGDLVITFSQPVKDPVLHFAGLGGSYSFKLQGATNIAANYKSTFFTTELEMKSLELTSTLLSGNNLISLVGNDLRNNYTKPNGNSTQVLGEFPIDNYGAISGSVRINGVVQRIVYKVWLKGSPNSTPGVNWSAQGVDSTTLPNPTSIIQDATRDPFTGDIWWSSISVLSPTQQLSGNIFNDKDGLTDSTITRSSNAPNPKTNAGGLLYVNLLNPITNTVIATMRVTEDGLYLFDSIAAGSYIVQLTKNMGVVNNAAPLTELPIGWVNTGEKNGLFSGDDGVINGLTALITIAPEQISTDNNFGIERIPNSNPFVKTIPSPVSMIAQGSATIPVTGTDPEQGNINNTDLIRITTLPINATMFYNNVPVTVDQVIPNFNPLLLSYTTITAGSTKVIFEYAFIDLAGFQDPTPATYELNWSVPLSIVIMELTGQAKPISNVLTINIGSKVNDLSALKLYRTENGKPEELVKELAITGKTYIVSDTKVESNKTYIYHAIATTTDGEKTKSNIVTLSRTQGNAVVVYPNPVFTELNIAFDNNLNEAATAQIMDARGRVVYVTTIAAGIKIHKLNVSKLANGNYTININNAGVLNNIKFTKQ